MDFTFSFLFYSDYGTTMVIFKQVFCSAIYRGREVKRESQHTDKLLFLILQNYNYDILTILKAKTSIADTKCFLMKYRTLITDSGWDMSKAATD